VTVQRAAFAELHLADQRVVDEAHAERLRAFGEEVLEDAAVDLPARHRQRAAGAELGDVLQVAPAFAEEEAEAELLQLVFHQVLTQAQHVLEVMRADLHARLADLVAGRRYRVRAAFHHQHVEVGEAALELQGQRQAGQAAAHDEDVVLRFGGGHGGVYS
jgi:hypothetical protein